jgi:hypothetical protein
VLLLELLSTSRAAAQIIVAPAPAVVAPAGVVVGGSVALVKDRRQVVIGRTSAAYGLWAVTPAPVLSPPYPVIDNRVTIRVTPVVVMPPLAPAQAADLRGVDLDVVGPEALQPGVMANRARVPLPPPKKEPLNPPPEVAKKPEAPVPPPPPAPAKKAAPPAAKPAPPPAPEKPPPPRPAEPLDESRRLLELGLTAFTFQLYGLAARRFDQAAEAEPTQAIPYFLLAQAYVAVGKYKEAVAAIESGMAREPNWPLSRFQPRVDMYAGIEDEWLAHKKQLADVQAQHPNQPTYLFLKAYEWWFDDQRQEAALLFARAQALDPNNRVIAAFLKAAR